MTAYDNWLTQGSERPELDERALDHAVGLAGDWMDQEHVAQVLYDAHDAIVHALREIVFPPHLRPYFAELAKLSADIRAKVDDEYKSLTEIYNDPRDE